MDMPNVRPRSHHGAGQGATLALDDAEQGAAMSEDELADAYKGLAEAMWEFLTIHEQTTGEDDK